MRTVLGEQFTDIPLTLLRRYLAAVGWRLEQPSAPPALLAKPRLLASRFGGARKFEIFSWTDDTSNIEILLPTDAASAEYKARVQDALHTLQITEDRDVRDVVSDITSIGYDVVRSRLPNSYALNESIHLDSAVSHMSTMRKLLTSAATTELRPLPFYGRVRREAKSYSERCMFGHTFRGSFGFTIQSPLSTPSESNGLFEPDPPFERRVIQRLTSGIGAISAAVERNSLAPAVNNIQPSLSANGFDILADMVQEAGTRLNLSFSLSREWISVSSQSRVSEFEITPRHLEVAREAAIALRRRSFDEEVTIVGEVITLRNESNPAHLTKDAENREVSVNWKSPDLGRVKVRVALDGEDYLRALRAHELGLSVGVSGRLEKVGRRWVLKNPYGLRT